jgi:hypothetical protein
MLRFVFFILACAIPVSAAESALPLVKWTNAKLGDDGVLEAAVTGTGGVTIDAGHSTFSPALTPTKDAVNEIVGNAVVLHLGDGKDNSSETIADAVKAGHYAELALKVSGLAEGTVLRVTGLSYQARPNGHRQAEVRGAALSQAWISGKLVGEVSKPNLGWVETYAAKGFDLAMHNGDTFTARLYFAGFDGEAKKGVKYEPFHTGVRFGNVQVFGHVDAPVKLTAFPPDVHAVLQKHCFACHGEKKQKGDIRLDTLSTDFLKDRAASEIWHDALDVVSIGEMPPEDEPRLSEQERGLLTSWIRRQMDAALAATKKEGTDIVMRRLNKDEYRYTMTDLLGMAGDYGERLPTDPLSSEGFANDGATLSMTGMQIETYLESARAALADVLIDGPKPERTETRVVDGSDKLDANSDLRFGKENVSDRGQILDRTGVFTAVFGKDPVERKKVPGKGRFTIRVKARAEFKPGQPAPIMRVVYGQKIPGSVPIHQEVGTLEITDAAAQVYEFSGLAQHFPYALETSPLAVQIVGVENILNDGQVKLPPLVMVTEGKKKTKKYELDPDFPRIIVESVQFIGNDYPQWPPADHRRILFAAANEGTPEYAREVLRRFLSRAWRSPVSDADLAEYHAHFVELSQQMSFVAAIRETLAVALSSPHFLYLVEPRLKKEADQPLNDHELATRLAYFLWSSMPDDALLDLAAKGTLKQPKVLAAQVERLLTDAKSQRFVEQFTTQWLDLGGLERVAVNPQYYPRFKDELKADMAGETKAFFGEILRTGSSALQFLDSDWTMLNAPLSKHYSLKGPQSQAFTRVSLTGTKHPGGLLGHASMHLTNSNGEDSHPIKRAVWIRERLLHDPPLPPPPNVPALPVEDPNFAKLSIREQMEIHRKDAACADCHRDIDAWGVALDHYDAVGLWRSIIRRPSGKTDKRGNPIFDRLPVDAKDILPGGVKLDGIESLKAYLMNERKDQFAHALVTKLLAFALGRSVAWTDEETVKHLTERFSASGYKLPALLADIVASEPFLKP